jgi:hypothetical protein
LVIVLLTKAALVNRTLVNGRAPGHQDS